MLVTDVRQVLFPRGILNNLDNDPHGLGPGPQGVALHHAPAEHQLAVGGRSDERVGRVVASPLFLLRVSRLFRVRLALGPRRDSRREWL